MRRLSLYMKNQRNQRIELSELQLENKVPTRLSHTNNFLKKSRPFLSDSIIMQTDFPLTLADSSRIMKEKTRKSIGLIAVLISIAFFYILTIRQGQYWGGDFSGYLAHAVNIIEGRPYGETGYIFNPNYPKLGPVSYPPVFPCILAPIIKFFGLNMLLMKCQVITTFILALLIIYFVFSETLPYIYSLLLLLLIGLHPLFWTHKDLILSDFPFLFFAFAALFAVMKEPKTAGFPLPHRFHAVFTGLLAWLAYGTRTIGIVILPSMIACRLIKNKKLTPFNLIALSVGFALILCQQLVLGGQTDYLRNLTSDISLLCNNVWDYIIDLSLLWDNGYDSLLHFLLFLVSAALACAGFITKIRKNCSVLEFFVMVYLAVIFVWPFSVKRYLFPLYILFLFYAFIALHRFFVKRKHLLKLTGWTIILCFFASLFAKYTTINFGPIQEGIAVTHTVELFDFIREHTEKEDVFIFRKPRVLAFFTDRKASVYHPAHPYLELIRYMRSIDADYVVLSDFFLEDVDYLQYFIRDCNNSFEPVFDNSDFMVFRFDDQHSPCSE